MYTETSSMTLEFCVKQGMQLLFHGLRPLIVSISPFVIMTHVKQNSTWKDSPILGSSEFSLQPFTEYCLLYLGEIYGNFGSTCQSTGVLLVPALYWY